MKDNYKIRYYVANEHHIPLRSQPEKGYTYKQAIMRVMRELDECVKIFGGKPQDYKDSFSVLEGKHFTEVLEARKDF